MKHLRIAIVEDEPVTARNLASILHALDDTIAILTTLTTGAEAITWFTANTEQYDLIFMDIRLADGLSFDIFKAVNILKPVIFVTAFNDYALPAFKNNGIDYILKPFDQKEIELALNKFKRWIKPVGTQVSAPITELLEQIVNMAKPFKKSFLVHFRDKLIPVETVRIAWFFTTNEIVYARTTDDRQYIMEFTMEQIEHQIDTHLFFRANRQFIVNRLAISEVDFYFNGRLSIKIKPEPIERILISKARVTEFRRWMDS